jgi:hypothetical protein
MFLLLIAGVGGSYRVVVIFVVAPDPNLLILLVVVWVINLTHPILVVWLTICVRRYNDALVLCSIVGKKKYNANSNYSMDREGNGVVYIVCHPVCVSTVRVLLCLGLLVALALMYVLLLRQ